MAESGIPRFDSEEDYRAHQRSDHVQTLFKEYGKYMDQPFVFYPIDTSDQGVSGGHERVKKDI
jgi:hypothetical protein